MKKRPHHRNNESAKDDHGQFTAQNTANHEKLRQKLIRDLFPKKATTCFECGTNLTRSGRKRMCDGGNSSGRTHMMGKQYATDCMAASRL